MAAKQLTEAEKAERAEAGRIADYWRSMRDILYQPTEAWLLTDSTKTRWLTDKYVLLDVTDSPQFTELPDGAYKLAFISKGPEPRDADLTNDMDAYLTSMGERDWKRAEPTMWSVIEEYNGKAMLWDGAGTPALLGEPTWLAIKRAYPDCVVEWSWRGNSVFRFSLDGKVFAYAGGIKMPEGQLDRAQAIVDTAYVPELDEAA